MTVGWTAIFTTGQRVEFPPQRYVNTHHRPMLAAEAWNQGPGLPAGQRSSLLEAVQHGRYGGDDLRWITFCRVLTGFVAEARTLVPPEGSAHYCPSHGT